jgi:hypothetical protein
MINFNNKLKLKEVIFASNGTTVVYDSSLKQIPELQKSYVILFVNHLKKQGFSYEQIEKITFRMPDGRIAQYNHKHNTWAITPCTWEE